jgi:mannose-6-phosphate isomerase-like protein (cupin superfamily)
MERGPSCSRVILPELVDERGRLMFAETGRHIPFEVQRVFAIYGVAANQSRGCHAHRRTHQFFIMLSGECTITFDNGLLTGHERLVGPTRGFHVPPLVWIVLSQFSAESVCLVLASELYDPTDYIRDFEEFKRISGQVRLG